MRMTPAEKLRLEEMFDLFFAGKQADLSAEICHYKTILNLLVVVAYTGCKVSCLAGGGRLLNPSQRH